MVMGVAVVVVTLFCFWWQLIPTDLSVSSPLTSLLPKLHFRFVPAVQNAHQAAN